MKKRESRDGRRVREEAQVCGSVSSGRQATKVNADDYTHIIIIRVINIVPFIDVGKS
jgi:hypothetical protein